MLIVDTEKVYQKLEHHDFQMEMSTRWRQLHASYISHDLPFLKYEEMKESAEHDIKNIMDEDSMWKMYDV
jgi:hypothetical protein